MNIKNIVSFLLLSVSFSVGFAQNQTVRGFLKDKESQAVIQNAKVLFESSAAASGNASNESFQTTTNNKGEFVITNVPVGRYAIAIEATEYQVFGTNNIIVTSGKEVILNYELEQSIERVGEITITAKSKGDKPNNDAALISARLFTVDETDRFAGSRGDPARMASNFAGVQGADDSRNDIVVRGNSPQGILWRLEGIDIPNPNHFAIPGTTGGSVSIINNKMLGNSDFFTGAFPAEYGNANAGAFDLKMKNGNNQKREFSSQLGLLGWDAHAEGYLGKKGGASYLLTYRYSTLAMFGALNIPIGTDAIPKYQDYAFKFNFPFKNNKGNISFFGIGGGSKIDILISNQEYGSTELYGDNDRDQYFRSNMHVWGSSTQLNLNSKSYLKATIAYTKQDVFANHVLIFRHLDSTKPNDEGKFPFVIDSIKPNLDYTFSTNSLGGHLFYNRKFSAKSSLRAGLQLTQYFYTFQDSNLNFDKSDPSLFNKFSVRWNANGTGFMAIPYVQWKYKVSSLLTISSGVQMQSFTISYDPTNVPYAAYKSSLTEKQSNTSVTGPLFRFGARYQITKKDALNLGLGMHSQNQSAYIYFYQKPGNSTPHNMNMGLSYSNHAIIGWDHSINKSSRFKIETYYQQLSNLPVEIRPSSFSLANTGSGFSRFFPDTLTNAGKGYNYGIEFTLERFFSKGFYYLLSGSLFDAQYQGSDKQWRSSDFNTNYAANALFAKEKVFKNKNSLNYGMKFTTAGARRYSPMDTLATINQREYVELDAQKNTMRFGKPYVRFDVRIAYRINAKKTSHEIAFDLVNITNRKNVLKYSFIDSAPYYRETYQLGFLPLFYYKIDF